jgi:DNA-binding MarR family transcriptional regulator
MVEDANDCRGDRLTSQILRTAQVPAEVTVFARLLRAHQALRRALEMRLLADHGLTINDYETLLHLSREPEGRLRRVDLAERLLLTPSGITRLLEGLQRCGFVEKGTCDSDARVTYAVLTPAGRRRLEEAAGGHAAVMRDQIASRLDGEELEALGTLLARLPGTAEADGAACLPGEG